MFELGLALPDSARFQRRAEEVLRAVADGRGAIALLVLRSGNDFVCSIREGRAALPPPASARGSRAPLFLSAGGVAILQRLPAGEARAILAENTAREVARRGTGRLAALERMREMSLRCGFGVNAGDVVPGVHSVGMALRDARGQPFAAVCLVGTPASLPLERIDPLRSELEHVAVLLSGEARQFHM
jgi:DNA-binding IclR family transcriptional regulator